VTAIKQRYAAAAKFENAVEAVVDGPVRSGAITIFGNSWSGY